VTKYTAVETVLVQPTPEILSICADIDAQIEIFLEARHSVPPLGRFEAQTEAACLFNLAIRHAEGVIELTKKDLVLLPPPLLLREPHLRPQ
jgi:hypothetical protein